MKAKLLNYEDHWQEVKDAAMATIGKPTGKYPDSEWKKKILLAEHSPIRLLTFTVRIEDLPYWVSVHLTRHKVGVEHFVSTQRSDRTGIDREKLPQDALVMHTMVINAQALINISRKRMCLQASPETREAWHKVVELFYDIEPEIWDVCVQECIYRGFCPEMKSCGFAGNEIWRDVRKSYLEVGGME